MNQTVETIVARWRAAGSPVVQAAGTSEGVRKAWETRKLHGRGGEDIEAQAKAMRAGKTQMIVAYGDEQEAKKGQFGGKSVAVARYHPHQDEVTFWHKEPGTSEEREVLPRLGGQFTHQDIIKGLRRTAAASEEAHNQYSKDLADYVSRLDPHGTQGPHSGAYS